MQLSLIADQLRCKTTNGKLYQHNVLQPAPMTSAGLSKKFASDLSLAGDAGMWFSPVT